MEKTRGKKVGLVVDDVWQANELLQLSLVIGVMVYGLNWYLYLVRYPIGYLSIDIHVFIKWIQPGPEWLVCFCHGKHVLNSGKLPVASPEKWLQVPWWTQGCRFVVYTSSETGCHRWYQARSRCWFPADSLETQIVVEEEKVQIWQLQKENALRKSNLEKTLKLFPTFIGYLSNFTWRYLWLFSLLFQGWKHPMIPDLWLRNSPRLSADVGSQPRLGRWPRR